MLANSASKCGNMGGQWKGVKFLYLLCYILKRSPREKLTSLVVPKKSQLGKTLKYQKYMGHISISYYLRTSKDLRSPWKSAYSKCYDMILSWDSKVTWTLGGTSPFTARAGARFSLFTAVTAMFVTMASILICLVSEPPTNLEDWSNPYHKNDKTYQASQNLNSIIINRTFWIYQTPQSWDFFRCSKVHIFRLAIWEDQYDSCVRLVGEQVTPPYVGRENQWLQNHPQVSHEKNP